MYFLPDSGSAPILMNELAAFLASRGHDVEVITTIPRPPYHQDYRWRLFQKEQSNGFLVKRYRTNLTAHHIGRLAAWMIYTKWTILNLLTVRRGDVLFLRLPPLQLGITGYLAKKLKGAGVLLSVQDIHPDLSIESGLLRNPRAISMAQKFEKWVYKKADEIVVISEGFQKNLEAKGVSSGKLNIVPNWVDTEFLKPLPKGNPLAEKYSLTDKFVIMYSGTISISSIMTLEKILESAKLLKGDKDTLFVIVGEGLKKAELGKKARELDLANVLFLPFQPYEDLPQLLASSDVLLVPLDKEKSHLSVPSKLYNFMAAGRPILGLTDDESEVAHIIKAADCGLNADPEDIKKIVGQIRTLKESPERCKSLGKNARDHAVKHYAKDKVLREYEEIIKNIGLCHARSGSDEAIPFI